MTDSGAAFQPGADEVTVPFRPRSTYVGYRAFGDGDGAVLVKPEVSRDLRSAAEYATQERRITGGLLYGRGWTDDQGAYLVVDGYLEAGPGENRHDRISSHGADDFTLSQADLRLLRQDAARMYSAELAVGWWRTLPGLGEFGPKDFETQAELVGPDGVGLLVYGSGLHWGTAYLGPDGLTPDSAGTLVAVSDDSEPLLGPAPLEQEPLPGDAAPGTPAPRRRRVRVPTRRRARSADPVYTAEPNLPTDVRLVVGALIVVTVVAAFLVGVLTSSATVAVIIAVVGVLAILSTVWMSRR